MQFKRRTGTICRMNTETASTQPLAALLRPKTIDQVIGQQHLLAPGKPLFQALTQGQLHSMVLWGPPGSGKTTLARILASNTNAHFITLSAVMAGVKDIRAAVSKAQELQPQNIPTILFIDEVHRFNKSQQDAFLPFVEDGTIVFIGATTANPSFEINSALLSRTRVYVLKPLTSDDLLQLINNAVPQFAPEIDFPEKERTLLAHAADGDARRCLNFLEIAIQLAQSNENNIITENIINEVIAGSMRRFDKQGDVFYEQISALHKSVRGSDPDAALYWFSRMIDGGCDPLYIVRRVVRMASEDIGNADPRALQIALNAWETYERLGSPEGELAIAQAIVFLSVAAKSNATYVAFNEAFADAQRSGSLEVPMHIRNAPTRLMKDLGYGKNYRYAHDEKDAYAAGENYFPDNMPAKTYYRPVDRGLEIKIKAKLAELKRHR